TARGIASYLRWILKIPEPGQPHLGAGEGFEHLFANLFLAALRLPQPEFSNLAAETNIRIHGAAADEMPAGGVGCREFVYRGRRPDEQAILVKRHPARSEHDCKMVPLAHFEGIGSFQPSCWR